MDEDATTDATKGETGLDIATAASRLGVSTATLRKRLARGLARGYKLDGRWCVVLDGRRDGPAKAATERPDEGRDQDATVAPDMLDTLRDEVRWLRDELERRDEVKDRQIAELHVLLQRALEQRPAFCAVGA